MAKLHHELSGTPRQANFILAVCSKAFNLAELWAMRPEGTTPCTRIERNAENARERFLSDAELARLGATLRQALTDGLPWQADPTQPASKHLPKPENRRTLYARVTTAAIELLLYTGCRLSEVLNLRWDQVDFGAGTVVLAETKAGRPQLVALNGPARRVLMELHTAKKSAWVLPSADAQRPLSRTAIENAWQKIRAAAGLEDVRLHDLRHTVGTYAGQTGANAFQVRDLLRHTDLSMTGRYVNRAEDPVRTLSDRVGERIAAGLEGRPRGEIVPLKTEA
jgi:integrase